jgi:glycosyltransferase involved in cell wall biosynthesis
MARSAEKKEVVIVQITCPHYRVPFFCGLRERLDRHGVTLRLLYGVSEKYGADIRANHSELPWAEPFMPWILPFRSATLEPVIWHPILTRVLGADLYLLYAVHALGGPRLAFWGHGWNHFLDDRASRAERLKHWLGKRADWYFAYTGEVERGLVERGYAPARITDVQNAVAAPPPCELTAQQKAALRKDWGIGPHDPVALYCGRMYGAKRLDFLLDAAEAAHRDLPSFHLVVIGGGPDEAMVREAARQRSYVHFAGAAFGKRKHELCLPPRRAARGEPLSLSQPRDLLSEGRRERIGLAGRHGVLRPGDVAAGDRRWAARQAHGRLCRNRPDHHHGRNGQALRRRRRRGARGEPAG